MKVIIPMAGRGTRLRPHTLTLPKPLLKISGKSIIEWIVEEIKQSISSKIEEIHYVIGDFGKNIEELLINTAEKIGSKGFIHYQKEPLGTAHAIHCARRALKGEVFIAFADTIFKGEIVIDSKVDGIIWTMLVEDPEKYGVVRADESKIITEFVEKPKDIISRNAIVGLYYFKEADKLAFEIDKLIKNNLRENNEFQITNCLEELKNKGNKLKCAELNEWLDCGNKQELLATNKRMLEIEGGDYYIESNATIINSEILGGSSIGENVKLENSIIENSIIYNNTTIENSHIKDSIIGENCIVRNLKGRIFISDYSEAILE